ncbi:MAG: winged helix-turn-helix transcriptional regulator, partial [Nanoarchaeota archaeon]
MKDSIDEKDKKILEILQENSSLSSHKISKRTLIPVTTVNNRIKKLKNLGVIKKFTVDIDKSKLGFSLVAYIFLTVSLEELKQEG